VITHPLDAWSATIYRNCWKKVNLSTAPVIERWRTLSRFARRLFIHHLTRQLPFYENGYRYRSVLGSRKACESDPALLVKNPSHQAWCRQSNCSLSFPPVELELIKNRTIPGFICGHRLSAALASAASIGSRNESGRPDSEASRSRPVAALSNRMFAQSERSGCLR
jgi:hypothetical protein